LLWRQAFEHAATGVGQDLVDVVERLCAAIALDEDGTTSADSSEHPLRRHAPPTTFTASTATATATTSTTTTASTATSTATTSTSSNASLVASPPSVGRFVRARTIAATWIAPPSTSWEGTFCIIVALALVISTWLATTLIVPVISATPVVSTRLVTAVVTVCPCH